MAFCANCGTEVQGRFCPKCGAAAPGANPAAAQANVGGAPAPPNYAAAPQAAGLEENIACALCYALGLITAVLFLVLAPYNQSRLVRFHAFQSLFLNLAWIVIFIAISIISVVLLPIPFLGAIVGLILHLGAGLGAFLLWLMLMYKAYNKERWVLPVIGPLAEKQANQN